MSKDKIKNSITGYGLVFKRVMKDTTISIEAKALYSYLSSYAGVDETAFPSVDLIKHELAIGKQRYQRARKELETAGYLQVDRKQNGNIYGSNLYTIYHSPRWVDSRPVEIQSVEIQSLDNQPTTINSITNNIIIAQLTLRMSNLRNGGNFTTRRKIRKYLLLNSNHA